MTELNLDSLERIGEDEVFQSRSFARSWSAHAAAHKHHKEKGRLLTELPDAERWAEICHFRRWKKLDIMLLCEGVRLPKKRGLYGFFNLAEATPPMEKILYVGQSKKSLSSRVTKNHSKYCYALRHGATHVGFITWNGPDDMTHYIDAHEIALIQKWSPYLNRDENPFNYEVESLRF